jgi:hypothetical protein
VQDAAAVGEAGTRRERGPHPVGGDFDDLDANVLGEMPIVVHVHARFL